MTSVKKNKLCKKHLVGAEAGITTKVSKTKNLKGGI